MTEKWITGYEGLYKINTSGNVTSYKTSNTKILKGSLDYHGYRRVTLTDSEGRQSAVKIHKLVAEHFIDPIEGKTCIDHINENKEDNNVKNLRWCTVSENLAFYNSKPERVLARKKKKQEKAANRKYESMEEMVEVTGNPIVVQGQQFRSCGAAASWVVEEEGKIGQTRNKATVSKELRRFLQGRRPAWVLYNRYTIGT